MRNIKHSDIKLLREMEEEYGTNTIANAILAISNNENGDVQISVTEPKLAKDGVLEYIKQLEGFRIRLREFHWSTTHNSLHTLTDDMIEKLEDYEDSIAEDFMGIIDERIKVNQIVPIMPKATELKSMIREIVSATYTIIASVESDKEYIGIVNVLEEIVDYLWKCRYKETLQ